MTGNTIVGLPANALDAIDGDLDETGTRFIGPVRNTVENALRMSLEAAIEDTLNALVATDLAEKTTLGDTVVYNGTMMGEDVAKATRIVKELANHRKEV